VIDRIRKPLAVRRNKTEGGHLRWLILLDNPRAKATLPFSRCDANGRTGLGEARGFIGGRADFALRDRHWHGLPQIAEGFGVVAECGGQGSDGCVLHVRLGHRLDGDQPPGGQADLPAQFFGGLVGFHAMPPHEFAEMDNLYIHDCSSYQMFLDMK
jgi:hypothetical protein